MSEWAPSAALVGAGAAAALMLQSAWGIKAGPRRAGLIIAAWTLMTAGVACAAWPLGAARGPFIALALIPAAALIIVAFNLKVRTARNRQARGIALEPSDRPSRAWRGWLRALLAGPIGGIAAMGVGLACAVFAPGDPQTRIVLGGTLVPILWGAGMAWTLSDDRILRATAVLCGVALLTFTASALRGFS